MNKMTSLFGPTLDNYGQFEVSLGDYDQPIVDTFDRLITKRRDVWFLTKN